MNFGGMGLQQSIKGVDLIPLKYTDRDYKLNKKKAYKILERIANSLGMYNRLNSR
jgi:hypothetical protein